MAIPKHHQKFIQDFPEVSAGYEKLGQAVHAAGPLDEKTCNLIKLGISTAAQLEGAVHSHVRKARESGASANEIRHAVLLAMPTIGLPATMAAMSWADDLLEGG